jgi:hypothetical protein
MKLLLVTNLVIRIKQIEHALIAVHLQGYYIVFCTKRVLNFNIVLDIEKYLDHKSCSTGSSIAIQ